MRAIRSIPVPSYAWLTAAAMTFSMQVSATAITAIDAFTITRSGINASLLGTYEGQQLLYQDSFSDGAAPPSGGTFSNGTTGTYNVLGTYPGSAESGGALALDSSLGGDFTNANGGGRTLQRSILLTDVDPTSQAGLKEAFNTFSVFGLFDLTIPPSPADGYGILLNDGGPSGATESLDLFVRREENNNVVIRFQEQDYLNQMINTIALNALLVPLGADQIELRLQRADLGTDAITAAYRYWDNGVAMSSFIDIAGSADFFTSNGWARGGFFAVEALQAVPEPGTLGLFGGALLGLAAVRRRRASA